MGWNPFGLVGSGLSRLGTPRTQTATFGHPRTLTPMGGHLGPVADPQAQPPMAPFLARQGHTGLPPYAGYQGGPIAGHTLGAMLQRFGGHQIQPPTMVAPMPIAPQPGLMAPDPRMPTMIGESMPPPQAPVETPAEANTLGSWLRRRTLAGSY